MKNNNDIKLIRNNIPLTEEQNTILKKFARTDRRTLKATIQIALEEYIHHRISSEQHSFR